MEDDVQDFWSMKIDEYRSCEPTKTVLEMVKQPRLIVDKTLESELKNYLIFNQNLEQVVKGIRGPADYESALEQFDQIQRSKDRVAEIIIVCKRILMDLDNLLEISKSWIILQSEVYSAKNEAMRHAIVFRSTYEVHDLILRTKTIADTAEVVQRSLNKSFDILAEQTEVVKQMMYWRSLSLPDTKPSSLKLDRS